MPGVIIENRTSVFDPKSTGVEVVEYQVDWPKQFEEEKLSLGSNREIAPYIVKIHHVGSTSVPDLSAKPIIDILIDVRDINSADQILPALTDMGYTHLPQTHNYELRRFLRKYAETSFHMHVAVMTEHNNWRNRIFIFGDYLKLHPETAKDYGQLKRDLAERFPTDRRSYAEGKVSFIDRVIAQALDDPSFDAYKSIMRQ